MAETLLAHLAVSCTVQRESVANEVSPVIAHERPAGNVERMIADRLETAAIRTQENVTTA